MEAWWEGAGGWVMEEGMGGRKETEREGTGMGGWCEKRSEVKADVNTNAKFLVIVTCHMTQKIQKWSVFNLLHFLFLVR